ADLRGGAVVGADRRDLADRVDRAALHADLAARAADLVDPGDGAVVLVQLRHDRAVLVHDGLGRADPGAERAVDALVRREDAEGLPRLALDDGHRAFLGAQGAPDALLLEDEESHRRRMISAGRAP